MVCAALLLGGCASYSGRGLKPGEASLEEVLHLMGTPAMRWQDADGSVQLAYPRGPMGVQTFMAYIGQDGRLREIRNVLDRADFNRIRPGMTQEQVLRILGPSYPAWTIHFKALGEFSWEWRYCNTWNEASRFDVMFDQETGLVRSTLSQTEEQMGLCGRGACVCSH